jgi:hypothetical protein
MLAGGEEIEAGLLSRNTQINQLGHRELFVSQRQPEYQLLLFLLSFRWDFCTTAAGFRKSNRDRLLSALNLFAGTAGL